MTDNVTKIWGVSLSILAFSLAVSTASAQTCGSQPSCSVLGYTHSDDECAGQETLKCPFDYELVYCNSPQTLTEKTCAVGDIVYSNGKCYQETPSGLTVKGIVFDAQNRKAFVKNASGSIPSAVIANAQITICGDANYCLGTGPTSGEANTQALRNFVTSTHGAIPMPAPLAADGYIGSLRELKLVGERLFGKMSSMTCSSDFADKNGNGLGISYSESAETMGCSVYGIVTTY